MIEVPFWDNVAQTGEISYRRVYTREEAREFLVGPPKKALLGLESSGFSQWFEGLVEE